jgi:hypothetical protein
MMTRLDTARQQYVAGDYAAAIATAKGLVRRLGQ